MSVLISPSNNTGWGLGVSKMYGGAKRRSSEHPVRVRGHYRAPWGAHKRGRTGRTTVDEVIDSVVADAANYTPGAAGPSTVDSVIDSVVANARAYARRKQRRRRAAAARRLTPAMRAARAVLRRARRVGRQALRRAASNARVRRRAARRAAAAISRMSRGRRGNVYWVRDSVTGLRVPVRFRPPRQ
ncbi:pVII [Simian adenovirus 49]|uniref:Pre-histone-like nucleoprotein n=1 Tax=Simian adenovirus 49 TaxID=995022 RepID=F2WTK6_9ADEN|nr:pVII [Simian adenovirus 49]ADZ39841.1 pVII [Simian adenovirus 49]